MSIITDEMVEVIAKGIREYESAHIVLGALVPMIGEELAKIADSKRPWCCIHAKEIGEEIRAATASHDEAVAK